MARPRARGGRRDGARGHQDSRAGRESSARGSGARGKGGGKERMKSGFVSILGRPNAGKSTLLNALLGQKLAIVTSKPQTTRTSIQGVVSTGDYQIVFTDTPGIHKSNTLLNKRMMDTVRTAAGAPDVVLFVVDALAPFTDEDVEALDLAKKVEAPV